MYVWSSTPEPLSAIMYEHVMEIAKFGCSVV